jgi:hypothetical protein
MIVLWDFAPCSMVHMPLQNRALGVFVAKGSNILGRQTGLWSTVSKLLRHRAEDCMALRWWQQCRKRSLRGTEQYLVVSRPSTRMGLCWWWLFDYPVLVGLICTTRNPQKNGEGFSWIQISSLGETILWNQESLMRFCYVRYCTFSEAPKYWRKKQMGKRKRSEVVAVHGSPSDPTSHADGIY